jgi:hypothetical protein
LDDFDSFDIPHRLLKHPTFLHRLMSSQGRRLSTRVKDA